MRIAAIDAGTNGLRLVVAEASSPARITVLESERYPVRLGHNVFTTGRFDAETMRLAVKAFRHFHAIMARYRVERVRAVATSACREAANGPALLARIRRAAGIRLEVISGDEEARLVRAAVAGAIQSERQPDLIVDLGGGSLEINLMRGEQVERCATLPLGTVRLMEGLGISGSISAHAARQLRDRVFAALGRRLGRRPNLSRGTVVACGGNAEALAQIAPGRRGSGIATCSAAALARRLPSILGAEVPERMDRFRVRRDRAEVLGVAAIVFASLAEWMRIREYLVPGVGVREGVLRGIVEELFPSDPAPRPGAADRARIASAQRFGRRFRIDESRAEHVRSLAAELFDQLRPVHGLSRDLRPLLEIGALLHETGRAVGEKDYPRHGEYLVRRGEIAGLTDWRRNVVACLVRSHGDADPAPQHKPYAALDPGRRRAARGLVSILRLACALDGDPKRAIRVVSVGFLAGEVRLRVRAPAGAARRLAQARRQASLFEKEFDVRVVLVPEPRRGPRVARRGRG